MAAAGAAGGATYVDDVFSTYLYKGTGSTQTITNNIDVLTEGGMTWLKKRNASGFHYIYDSLRTTSTTNSNSVDSSRNTGQMNSYDGLNEFTTSGFVVNTLTHVNGNGDEQASWTFRKSKGFFDVVKFSVTNSSNQRVSHSLGCVPGLILMKRLSGTGSWVVYHRDLGPDAYIQLNTNSAKLDSQTGYFGPDGPTATDFGVKSNAFWDYGPPADEIIAYVFAGGESTAATARSVDFDGSSYLESSSSDYDMGTGDFTAELWFKTDSTSIQRLFDKRTGSNTSGGVLSIWNSQLYWHSNGSSVGYGINYGGRIDLGQWYHAAVVRQSSTTKLYLNGKHVATTSNDTVNYDTNYVRFGEAYNGGYNLDGKISNFRLVVGTALYTDSFKPPTETLTSITNTKLLCCNNSSVTGKTVGGTITKGGPGTVTASSDAPFDDSECFKFGAGEDQNIIKTGSYRGNGGTDGPEVYLGWEPQWVMVKNISTTGLWLMADNMRGIVTGGQNNDPYLQANDDDSEYTSYHWIRVTPTGFKLENTGVSLNGNHDYVYIAMRRPDPLVGKPPEAASEVFAMDTGAGNSIIPNFDSNFPVDFALQRNPNGSYYFDAAARLIQGFYLQTGNTNQDGSSSAYEFDNNVGWGSANWMASTQQSWMWKRYAGFDAVTYKGNSSSDSSGASQLIPHNLGRAPEMIWTKGRDGGSGYWGVYHKGLNGGTNPWNYRLLLNETNAQSDGGGSYTTWYWGDTAPTATHFTVGEISNSNANNTNFIAMLFASVDGISKVGSYVGQGSDLTVEFGFSPRFLMVKRIDSTGDWNVFDTTRGLVSGADKELRLNNTSAQSDHEVGDITSTGFTFACGGSHDTCSAGGTWIYYAHA